MNRTSIGGMGARLASLAAMAIAGSAEANSHVGRLQDALAYHKDDLNSLKATRAPRSKSTHKQNRRKAARGVK